MDITSSGQCLVTYVCSLDRCVIKHIKKALEAVSENQVGDRSKGKQCYTIPIGNRFSFIALQWFSQIAEAAVCTSKKRSIEARLVYYVFQDSSHVPSKKAVISMVPFHSGIDEAIKKERRNKLLIV